MKINASCVYDREATNALASIIIFRDSINYKKGIPNMLTLVMCFSFGAVWCFGVLYSVQKMLGGSDSYHLICLLGLTMTALGVFISILTMSKRIRNAADNMTGNANKYTFENELFTVESENRGAVGVGSVDYKKIYRVDETSKYIFIHMYMSNIRADGQSNIKTLSSYIVDKSTIDEEDMRQIREKLSAALGRKYIVCKY